MSESFCRELPSNVSGWRIEQKYSPGVLIGNWSEDRFGKASIRKALP